MADVDSFWAVLFFLQEGRCKVKGMDEVPAGFMLVLSTMLLPQVDDVSLAAAAMAAINVLFRMHGKDAWIRVVG